MLDNTTNSTDLMDALQNTTMLAALRSSALGLRRQDKQTAREVSQAHHAAENAVATSINRLAGADTLHKEIIGCQADARGVFNEHTSIWDDDGWRLLPAKLFEPLVKALSPHMKRMGELKEKLRDEAPMILARVNLGGLAGRVKLPTADEMAGAYSMRTEFAPIPDGSRLHVNLPGATVDRLREHVEARVRDKAAQALLEPAQRCADVLFNMVERIRVYDQRLVDQAAGKDVGRSGVFRDSLVEHVQDVAKILDAFNVLGDPMFAEIVVHVKAIVNGDFAEIGRERRQDAGASVAEVNQERGGLTAEKLREDAGVRAQTLTAAESVINKLREYGA